MRLESERVYLQVMHVPDVTERYVSWMNDPEVNEYLESKYQQQSYASVCAFVQSAEDDPNSYLYGIYDLESDQHIGNIKFTYTNRRHLRGDIGIVIGERAYWGKGIAAEAIQCLTEYVSEVLGVEKISAGCFEINRGSVRAFEKAGYAVEGVIKDNVLYGDRRINGILLGITLDKLR